MMVGLVGLRTAEGFMEVILGAGVGDDLCRRDPIAEVQEPRDLDVRTHPYLGTWLNPPPMCSRSQIETLGPTESESLPRGQQVQRRPSGVFAF